MISDVPNHLGYEPLPRRLKPRVPQYRSRAWALVLVLLDAGFAFGFSTVLLATRAQRIGAGLLAASVVCVVSALAGRYRETYAVYARDEAYFTAIVSVVAALPLVAVLVYAGHLSWHTAVLMTVLLVAALIGSHFALACAEDAQPRSGEITHLSERALSDRQGAGDRLRKRIFDLVVAGVAVLVLSPIMLAVALAVLLDSGKPVFFRQERVGCDGRYFWILKFRTMRVDSGSHWVKPGDERITRIGAFLRRTSLDELPQLFNVLRGEMSIVGPRPEMRTFAEQFARTLPRYSERHVVPPGITGWAQVYLPRNLEPSDMPRVLAYDLFYVEHAGRLLDCAIVLKTAFEVLFHRAV